MARIQIANIISEPALQFLLTNAEDNLDMKRGALANVFTYSNLVHAIAGAVGSVVGLTVFFPLDTARTRLQVDEKRKAEYSYAVILDIIKQEGFFSLYRGLIPVISSLCCSNFVYFYTYNCMKTVFIGEGVKPDPFKDLTFAFVSGVVNVLVTTPLWVVNTRLKLQGIKFETDEYRGDKQVRYSGILDCLLKIVKTEGILSLWAGVKPSVILASNPAIQFMVYETIKRYFQKTLHQTELSGFLYFIIGAIAKTVATIITYPLQILQSRQRAGYNKESQRKSMREAFKDILRQYGFAGLYKGLEAKLLQTVLTAALMFLVYEKIAFATFRLMGQEYSKTS